MKKAVIIAGGGIGLVALAMIAGPALFEDTEEIRMPPRIAATATPVSTPLEETPVPTLAPEEPWTK